MLSPWITPQGSPTDFYTSPREGKFASVTAEVWGDISRLHTHQRHRMMVNDGRYIYGRSEVLRHALRQKSDFSIGRAWRPQYLGDDEEYKRVAEPEIERWMRVCNTRGRAFGFQKILSLASVSIDREGDFFIIRRKGRDGFPLLTTREGSQIGNRAGMEVVQDGRWDGLPIENGVVYDDRRRPVLFNFLGLKPEDDKLIRARDVIHGYDPEYFSQGRGIPSVVNGIYRWFSRDTILAAEEAAVVINSKLALTDSNHALKQTGAQKVVNQAAAGGASKDETPTVEMLEDGLIAYVKSPGELAAHNHNRPSATFSGFMEHLTRAGIVGAGWSYEMAWDNRQLRGPAARAVGEITQRSVDARQVVLNPPAIAMLLHGVIGLTQMGRIPEVEDWHNWGFTLPPKWSIDIGRDVKSDQAMLHEGILNERDWLTRLGKDPEEHWRQRARDIRRKEEIAAEEGVDVAKMGFSTPNGNAPQA